MDWEAIYDKYEIPPNLRRHMKLVAKVGRRIAECLAGKVDVDPDFVERLGMLHDMGNILKFRFLPEEKEIYGLADLERWKEVQERFRKKYGNSEFMATIKICRELGFHREADLFEELYSNPEGHVLEMGWNAKVFVYADFRVGPKGIVTLDDRIRYLCWRYNTSPERFRYAYELEKMISKFCDIEEAISR